MDLCCARCGEPSDYTYIREEFSVKEQRLFFDGVGCDCCGWGTACKRCQGTGEVYLYSFSFADPCPDCEGTGKAGEEERTELQDSFAVAAAELGDDLDGLASTLDGLA